MSDIEGKNATVRREDQLEINEFGKLNGRKKELKEELEAVEVRFNVAYITAPHYKGQPGWGQLHFIFSHSFILSIIIGTLLRLFLFTLLYFFTFRNDWLAGRRRRRV